MCISAVSSMIVACSLPYGFICYMCYPSLRRLGLVIAWLYRFTIIHPCISPRYVIYLVIISCKMQTYGDQILAIYHRFLRRRFFERSVSRFIMKCSYNAGEMSEDQLCVPSLNKTRYSVCPLDCRWRITLIGGSYCASLSSLSLASTSESWDFTTPATDSGGLTMSKQSLFSL